MQLLPLFCHNAKAQGDGGMSKGINMKTGEQKERSPYPLERNVIRRYFMFGLIIDNRAAYHVKRWLLGKINACFASWTSVNVRARRSLNNCLYLVLPAVCAKPVHWLGRLYSWLLGVYKNTPSHLFKFVLPFCYRPVFILQYGLFEIVFFFNQFLLLRLYRKGIRLYGKQYADQFGSTIPNLIVNVNRCKILCDVAGGFRGGEK